MLEKNILKKYTWKKFLNPKEKFAFVAFKVLKKKYWKIDDYGIEGPWEGSFLWLYRSLSKIFKIARVKYFRKLCAVTFHFPKENAFKEKHFYSFNIFRKKYFQKMSNFLLEDPFKITLEKSTLLTFVTRPHWLKSFI